MLKKSQIQSTVRKVLQILSALVILLGALQAGMPVNAEHFSGSPVTLTAAIQKVYLPIVKNGSASNLPLMAGVMAGWPDQATIDNVMKPMDKWITGETNGRSTSIFGTFLTLDLSSSAVKANVEDPLTVTWNAGYTPFINLPTNGDTAYTVATSEKYGTLITNWAKSFKNYANGGTRFAYIAPLQEMNGEWVTYGADPANYKRAYKRFQDIFNQVGVPAKSVKWVFAPNGWTKPGLPLFEEYYPGDANVDVVAISAYNFGYCGGGQWQEPVTVYNNPTFDNGHYLERMYSLAPSKPIFIAQTASSSFRTAGTKNPAEKERWLRDAYQYLAEQQNVRAVIYFNIPKECDWEIFTGDVRNQGYKDGIINNGYEYISPSELIAIDHIYR